MTISHTSNPSRQHIPIYDGRPLQPKKVKNLILQDVDWKRVTKRIGYLLGLGILGAGGLMAGAALLHFICGSEISSLKDYFSKDHYITTIKGALCLGSVSIGIMGGGIALFIYCRSKKETQFTIPEEEVSQETESQPPIQKLKSKRTEAQRIQAQENRQIRGRPSPLDSFDQGYRDNGPTYAQVAMKLADRRSPLLNTVLEED